jgi:hypothetical protein
MDFSGKIILTKEEKRRQEGKKKMMVHKISVSKKILTSVLCILCIIILPFSAQPGSNIRRENLNDHVVKWYRVKEGDTRPWFFKQVEKIFDVILPSENELPFGRSVAFLVGVSKYTYLEPQLPFVRNDIEDMRKFLLTKGGFDEVYVAQEEIVNRDLIEEYMKIKFPAMLNNRDRLLFYYAGHGADSGGKTGYMQFSKAKKRRFAGSQVLAIKDVSYWSSEIKINHLLFIFDCCASGLAFAPRGDNDHTYNKMIATLSRNGSRIVMTAGTADEKTYEVRGNGVFTRAFLNAAETGIADKYGDGFMTIDEIHARIKDEIAQFSVKYKKKVTPKLWELNEAYYRGTFVFVNPEAKGRKIALSPDYSEKLNARGAVVVARVGIIQLTSFITGKVYIDGSYVGNIESGTVTNYPPIKAGQHTIEVKGAKGTGKKEITVIKGKVTKAYISPERIDQYDETRVTQTTTPHEIERKDQPPISLRSTAKENLSRDDVKTMLKEKGLFDISWNESGKGIENKYELLEINGDKVVKDNVTGLIWQQSGSVVYMTYSQAETWIEDLNKKGFAGYHSWRLPTLEEAMSLMEPQEHGDLYIDEIFNRKQSWIWTSDEESSPVAWVVLFSSGRCYAYLVFNIFYVRAVVR